MCNQTVHCKKNAGDWAKEYSDFEVVKWLRGDSGSDVTSTLIGSTALLCCKSCAAELSPDKMPYICFHKHTAQKWQLKLKTEASAAEHEQCL